MHSQSIAPVTVSSAPAADPTPAPKLDWINIAFLTLTPIIGIPVTAYCTWQTGFEWWMLFLCLGLYLLVGLSICAGYHRYFSHKSYECSGVVQLFFAFFGALAAQNSILRWSAGHRRHHSYADTDWDPYNIKRGLWWAHMVWIFYEDVEDAKLKNVSDLKRNAWVNWQHRNYRSILLLGGFGIPLLIGALFGHPLMGLLWGGFLRIVIIHHTTFMVNSLSHRFGSHEFSADCSARDNWMVALVTLGEGYHSFHHRFPMDFRNGIRWYHWDPTKWFIRVLKLLGLASKLRSTAAPLIEQARMQAAVNRVEARIELVPDSQSQEIRRRIEEAREALEQAFVLWRQQAEERARGVSKAWKETRRESRRLLKQARKDWRGAMRMLAKTPEAA